MMSVAGTERHSSFRQPGPRPRNLLVITEIALVVPTGNARRKRERRDKDMRRADFVARIRKTEIANRVLVDKFSQHLQVTLADVDVTDENLKELRQFRPNELVLVTIEPVQQSLPIAPVPEPPARPVAEASARAGDPAAAKTRLVEEWRFER